MEAAELARWTRFAAKGGIGKCTAIQDCVAESPDDLMFLKDDEITVLMELPDEKGHYLGYCEGVVGRFQRSHVHFHSKLKRPVMTKRSSMTPAKSPTPTKQSPSPMSMLLMEVSNSHRLSKRSSRPPTDDEATVPPPMSYSSSSTLSDAVVVTPPLHLPEGRRQSPSYELSSPPFLSPPIVPTPPLSISPKKSPTKPVFTPPPRSPSPTPSHHEPETSEPDTNEPDTPAGSTRFSLASSDGEVGIGLSLLQNLVNDADDDWSSDAQSQYSKRSLVQTPEQLDDGPDESNTTPQAKFTSPSRSVTETSQASSRSRASSLKHSEREDWEGASDIYDDYRYSMASKLSRFSQVSHPSTAPPPIPDPHSIPPRPQSTDSDASIYTQDSKNSSHAQTLLVIEPSPDVSASKNRPSSLDLKNPSPLLHTSWGSPVSSPSAYSTTSFFSPASTSPTYSTAVTGMASAFRQQIKIEGASNISQPTVEEDKVVKEEAPVRSIVIEDDEGIPPHADDPTTAESAPSLQSSPEVVRQKLPPLSIGDDQATSSHNTPPSPSVEYPSPPDLAPPPLSNAFPPTAQPVPPSLSELRGYAPDQPTRASLFLPHPNAPKPSASSAGPMYIRSPPQQQQSPGPRNPAAAAINVMKMALNAGPKPAGPGVLRGPTIYGRVEVDLAVAQAPVPITFSIDPPVISIPSAQRPILTPMRNVSLPVPKDVPAQAEPSAGSAIPRANFFPKTGTARPRSRSFSGFNSSPAKAGPLNPEEGSATLGIPRSPPGSGPALRRPASSSKLRPSYAPSPLSLPQNNMSAGLADRSPFSPGIPSSLIAGRHPMRQMASLSPLSENTDTRPSGIQISSPIEAGPTSPVLQKQQSLPSVNGIAHSRTESLTTYSSRDPETASLSSSRSQVTSPVLVGRQASLRSKLSLPNLKKTGRQGSISSAKELVQFEDMDFELIRPSIPQISGRPSEDSTSFVDSTIDKPSPPFQRTDSPAMSMVSSGQRSPVVSDSGSWPKGPKTSDPESSIDAHRQRELKWVSLMSQTPASQSRKSKKIRKLLLEGVPSSVRYLVWSHLMDGKARNVTGVYTQLGQRARVPAFSDIERDVRKCFADQPQLSTTQGPVLSILQAYLTMVPDIQYTTGLTLITGHLLLLAPEEDAFWIFVSMMDTYLRPYFSSSTIQMEVDAALFGRALEANEATLAKKILTDMSIPPTRICYPWFSSLFVGTLPTDYLNRVWDIFLYEGHPFLLRVALALTCCCRRAILESRSEDAVLSCLRRPNLQWLPPSPEAFIALTQSLKLKDDDIRKQRVKMEAQVKRQTQQLPRMAPNSISLPRN